MEKSKLTSAKLVSGIEESGTGNNGVLIMQKNGVIRVVRIYPKRKKKKII